MDLQTVADMAQTIGQEQVRQAMTTLTEYKNAKGSLEARIIEEQRWYRLQHWAVIREQHADARPCAALLGHARADGWIDQKILPKSLGKCKSMPPEHIADHADIGQVVHRVGPLST